MTSHLLSAHGGEIFIHTLQVSRSCLDDLPSILEGAGGKVTDYRISDFAAHIQRHKLLPIVQNIERGPDINLQKARGILCKNTKYWPLTSTNTIIYNLRQVNEANTVCIHCVVEHNRIFALLIFGIHHMRCDVPSF